MSNETKGLFGPYCEWADSIRCKKEGCGKICVIGNLSVVNGKPIPMTQKPDSFWQPKYYCCPCDMDYPMAYDDGSGNIQQLEEFESELIPFCS